MKIVYLHQYFKTPRVNGGVRSYHFARALRAEGHEVHVITSDTSESGPRSGTSMVDGLVVHRIRVPYDNSMGFVRRVIAFLDFAVRASLRARSLRADVVVATSTPLTIAIPALWAVVGRPARFVFEVRDLWPTVPIAMGLLRNPVLIKVARMLEMATYRRADAIVALSQGMAEGVVQTSSSFADKVVVIPNIADVETFRQSAPAESAASRTISALGDRPVVLYSGTFGRVNGLKYMVQLAEAARSANVPCAFVAVGDGAERQDVEDEARRTGLLGTWFFTLPPVTKEELPALLQLATFGSSWVIDVPALEHNSANKFFDTLAAGRPMLINHGGWQAAVLERMGAGWRLDRDAVLAVEQLRVILADADLVADAGRAALALAENAYSLKLLSRLFTSVVVPPVATP